MNLSLPYPPSVNTYYATVNGRRVLSSKGRDYKRTVAFMVGKVEQITGRVGVGIELFMPDKRRRDIDNVQKALLDALQHAGVYEDDSQIDVLLVRRAGVEKGGRCEVEIVEINKLSKAFELEVYS